MMTAKSDLSNEHGLDGPPRLAIIVGIALAGIIGAVIAGPLLIALVALAVGQFELAGKFFAAQCLCWAALGCMVFGGSKRQGGSHG